MAEQSPVSNEIIPEKISEGLEARGLGLKYQLDELAESLRQMKPGKGKMEMILKLWKIFGLDGDPGIQTAAAIRRLNDLAAKAEGYAKGEHGAPYRQ